jgi:membrane protein YqaA with SNARE-associated domain
MIVAALLGGISLSKNAFVSLGAPGLFVVAVLEFFLLPVPPDVVLVPLVIATPEFALGYALIATAGSVLAGSMGYAIGRRGGRPVLQSRFDEERVTRYESYLDRNALAVVGIGAFAPLPEGYEILSTSAGALGLDFRAYLLASLLGRGGKYATEAVLVLALGEAATSLSEVDLYAATGAVAVVVVAAYLFRRFVLDPRRSDTS